MSWFDPDSITKNVSNLAQKASKLAQETLLDDPLLVELEDLKRERDALKLKLSESNGLKSIENDLEIEKLLNANAHLQKELNESHQKEQEASQMLSKIKTMAGEKIKRLTLQIQESERQPGSKNESSEAIIQDLQNQLEETLNSHQDQAKAFALEKQELKQIINTREMERDRFQQELIDYDSRQQEEAQRLKDALQEQRNLVQQLQSVAHDEESIRYNNLEKDRIAEELTLENDKLKAEVVACKSKLESLELKLKTKELENGGENDVENEEIVELKRQISQFQLNTSTEVQDWKQKYSELEKKYESSKLKIADHEKLVETTLQEHQNVVVQFEQKILELSSKPAVHNNTAVLEELTTPSDDQQEIISSLQDQVADLENVQVQLQNTLEQTKLKYKAALKDAEQAAELKQHITEYQARIVSLQQELAEATAHDQNELLSSVEYLTMELENARQEIAFLQSSSGEGNGVLLAEQQTQISVYQMEIQSLSEQLISAQAQNNEMESVLADLEASKSDLAEWKEKVEQLSIENQEKSLQYETQIIELSTMLEQAQYSTGNQSVGEDQIQNLNMQLDTLKLELQNANQEITYLQSISAAAGVSNQDGIIPLIVDSVQISQLQQQLQEYQTQCQSLENSCLEFQSVVENLSVENQALDQERTILSEKLDTFKQTVGVKIQQEMEESNRLKSLLEQSNHENENLMTQVQELSTHLANSQGNGDSQQEMEYLQKKTVELASQVQKSEAELNRLRSYLVEVEETSTNEVISMQSTIEEYQKQIAALEREREEWASVDQQEQELRESDKSLLLEAKQKLAEAVQERSSLQSKIDQDAITIKNLQNVLSQFENGKASY